MQTHPISVPGWWTPGKAQASPTSIAEAILHVARPLCVVEGPNGPEAVSEGSCHYGQAPAKARPLLAQVPALLPERLGDPVFCRAYGITYPYLGGSMAQGISSTAMVEALGRAGMLGFYGAAGQDLARIEAAIDRLTASLGDRPFGFNLIYSPADLQLERATVDLYLRREIHLIEASAFMQMTPALVYYRVKGLARGDDGRIHCANRVIAKVSRIEVAEKFLSPPPARTLAELLAAGAVTEAQAQMAQHVPMADDLTAEADSGGHTDNRPAITLLPTMIVLRDRLAQRFGYARPPCVGLAGGIATPASAAAAFAMGAAYVLTGSINQACVESGTCAAVRKMLAECRQADVIMAPAADMFELGVKVQVLKRGTMFAVRAAKLYDLYRRHASWDEVPADQRALVERDILRSGFDQAWDSTKAFFDRRDPVQVEKAAKDPHHRMALVFRSYLGLASKWAVTGEPARQIDYQIWCGPAMGAFNGWVQDSFLEQPENRRSVDVAMNLLYGAAVLTRAHWLKSQGVAVPAEVAGLRPKPLEEIQRLMGL